MQRHKPSSLRLFPPHKRPLIYLRATEEANRRSVGIERCSSGRKNLSSGRRKFCIVQPVISVPWSPVNKFTVLTIENSNTIDSELIDVLPLTLLVPAPLCKPKWEKRLPQLLSISTLDMCGTSLLLPVKIGTTDMSELHSVKAFLDCRATRSLINRDFVHLRGMNTQTLSCNILVFNVDSSPNKAGQISKVVDVVLRYKTHSKRMLLAISRLGKQSLILGYDWLKDHNPKIDWKKGEVEMTCCLPWCEGGHTLQKEQTCPKRVELRAL